MKNKIFLFAAVMLTAATSAMAGPLSKKENKQTETKPRAAINRKADFVLPLTDHDAEIWVDYEPIHGVGLPEINIFNMTDNLGMRFDLSKDGLDKDLANQLLKDVKSQNHDLKSLGYTLENGVLAFKGKPIMKYDRYSWDEWIAFGNLPSTDTENGFPKKSFPTKENLMLDLKNSIEKYMFGFNVPDIRVKSITLENGTEITVQDVANYKIPTTQPVDEKNTPKKVLNR